MTIGQPLSIAVLVTTFNRVDVTERGLRSLLAQDALEGGEIDLSVWILDDGSHDGTASMARALDPRITVLDGDGSSYWAGGMGRAQRAAMPTRPDLYLWFNDDVVLDSTALRTLLDTRASLLAQGVHDPVVSGATRTVEGELYTGGLRHAPASSFRFNGIRLAPLDDSARPCDVVHGNALLVSGPLLEEIDPFDGRFRHAFGDWDFGQRASERGSSCWIAPGYVGIGFPNPLAPYKRSDVALPARLRDIVSIKQLKPRYYWRYCARNFGIRAPLVFLRPFIATVTLGARTKLGVAGRFGR